MKKLVLAFTPFFAIAALNAFAFSNAERFPNPMATHWGLNGQADGFASLETHMSWTNFGLGIVALIWLLVAVIQTPAAIKRIFLLIVGYLFTVLFVLMAYLLVIQLDVTDPAQTSFGGWILLFLIPILGLIPLMLARPTVVVSDRVEVRLRGIPILRVPLSDVVKTQVGDVRAADFGGWGIRYANKTTAFVPNSGSALELVLTDQTKVLVRHDQPQQLVDQIMGRKAN